MRHAATVTVVASVVALTALAGGSVVGQGQTYVLEQDGSCTELRPVSYQDQTVEEFYGYTGTNNSTMKFSANTPVDLEERNDDYSTLFLYEGSGGLSLVVMHDGVNGSGGGAASMEFVGLPEDGTWAVRDDPPNESVEVWNRTTDDGVAVDWGWRGAYTDGGAFQGLGDDFEIQITPSFNDGAEIDPVTPGNVTGWRALSAGGDGVRAVNLSMDAPVTLRAGSC